jgi:hypothetical protein
MILHAKEVGPDMTLLFKLSAAKISSLLVLKAIIVVVIAEGAKKIKIEHKEKNAILIR